MKRWRSLSVLILALTAVYLYAVPTATILYAATVLLHTGVGVLATLGLLVFLVQGRKPETGLARGGWVALFLGGVLGVILIRIGTPHRLKAWLYGHIALCCLAVVL